jgi:hypothetical protein
LPITDGIRKLRRTDAVLNVNSISRVRPHDLERFYQRCDFWFGVGSLVLPVNMPYFRARSLKPKRAFAAVIPAPDKTFEARAA